MHLNSIRKEAEKIGKVGYDQDDVRKNLVNWINGLEQWILDRLYGESRMFDDIITGKKEEKIRERIIDGWQKAINKKASGDIIGKVSNDDGTLVIEEHNEVKMEKAVCLMIL